jgi:DNA-binding response OmpR family regulator
MANHSILLVEDEVHLHDALKLNLSLEGYEVTSAFDGPEALKQIENAAFDLIILDVMLPGIDGFAFESSEAISFSGEKILLTKKEAMLLKLLIDNKNKVVSREHILQTVWGYNVFPNTRTIDNFILNFRKYFEKDARQPAHFISIRGVGYKFQD